SIGIETKIKQSIKIGCDLRITIERRCNKALGISNTRLLKIAAIGTKNGDLTRIKPCGLNQRIIAIIIRLAAPDRPEHFLQHLTFIMKIYRSVKSIDQLHVVEKDRDTFPARFRQLDGLFANDAKTHMLKQGHTLRKHQWLTIMIKLE